MARSKTCVAGGAAVNIWNGQRDGCRQATAYSFCGNDARVRGNEMVDGGRVVRRGGAIVYVLGSLVIFFAVSGA